MKPKLFYADITPHLNFAICKEYVVCNNTTYFISSGNIDTILHIEKFLNSKLIDWYYRTLSVQLGEKAVRMFTIYVERIPIPKPKKLFQDIFRSYDLNPNEIDFINNLSL